jgi:ATP-dependent DNA helicase RecQ
MNASRSPSRAVKRAPGTLPSSVWQTLQDHFGIRRMRQGQEAVIARALAGQDTLAIMPTGAGTW